MDQQNKYYTPDISELHVGYCNYQVCYKKDIWTDAVPIVDGTQIDNVIDLLTGRVGFDSGAHVRTKYLDRSDIESCGWEHVGTMRDGGTTTYQINNKYILDYYGTNQILKETERYREITIKELAENHLFKHIVTVKCKSINELRTIMKWLNIK